MSRENNQITQYEIFNIVKKIDENENETIITLIGNYVVDINETIEQAIEKIDKRDWSILMNIASLTSHKVYEKLKEVKNENK